LEFSGQKAHFQPEAKTLNHSLPLLSQSPARDTSDLNKIKMGPPRNGVGFFEMSNISDKEIRSVISNLLKASERLDAAGFNKESAITLKIANKIINQRQLKRFSNIKNTIASNSPHLILRDSVPFDWTEKENIQLVINALEEVKNNGEDLNVEDEATISEAISELWSKLKSILNREKHDK
jgi:hypothetical protein